MTEVSKTKSVAIPPEIVGDCSRQENECLKVLVNAMRSSKTIYQQMNCFGMYKKEIRKVLLFYVFSSCIQQQRSLFILLLSPYPSFMSEYEKKCIGHW